MTKRKFNLPVFASGALVVVVAFGGCKRNATQEVVAPVSAGGSMHPYSAPMEKDDYQWVRAIKD